MEIVVSKDQSPAVYDKCIGCERHNKDIMISIRTTDNTFVDVFLDLHQAEYLKNQLEKKIDAHK